MSDGNMRELGSNPFAPQMAVETHLRTWGHLPDEECGNTDPVGFGCERKGIKPLDYGKVFSSKPKEKTSFPKMIIRKKHKKNGKRR